MKANGTSRKKISIENDSNELLFEKFIEFFERKTQERINAPIVRDTISDWVDVKTAMKLLCVGRTKMQQLKNEGKIRFTQDRKKLKFSRKSIEQYLNLHST